MSTLSKQVARRRAAAAKMAAAIAQDGAVTAPEAPGAPVNLPGHPRTPTSVQGFSEAPTPAQQASGSTGLTARPQEAVTAPGNTQDTSTPSPSVLTSPEGSQEPVYPTDWETELRADLPHVTFYHEGNPIITLPVETFLEISETLVLQTQEASEPVTRWVLTDPEDPELPPIINMMSGLELQHQLALDSELADALYPLVRREATVKAEPRSWRSWAKKNKWKAYSLYGFGGTVGAILLYNSVVTWLT